MVYRHIPIGTICYDQHKSDIIAATGCANLFGMSLLTSDSKYSNPKRYKVRIVQMLIYPQADDIALADARQSTLIMRSWPTKFKMDTCTI